MKYLKNILIAVSLVSIVTILAACTPKGYTLSYDTQTNETIESVQVEGGEAIFAPTEPERQGYRFDGWMYNNELFTFSVMPNEDVELVASWSKYVTLSFDTDGGTTIPSITIPQGDPIEFPDPPEKDHFKFTGWGIGGTAFTETVMPSSDTTLSAMWTPASTITFIATVYDRELDDMVEINVESLVEVPGETVSAPQEPRYLGYKFVSWQLDQTDYEFTTMPDTDITLTATWMELSNLPALFIDLFDDEGDEVLLQQVNRTNYVTSIMSLENTDDENMIIAADALFKGRGNGSWVDSGDKRGYRIKFDEKQSILGNPESRHWVLLAGANFDDVTMFRNKLAFDMTNEVFTNIEYASSTQWVDVYINGEYRGVYLLAEHLRVDDDRVEIDSEFGVEDTGYLIELDAYASGTNGVDYFRVDGSRYAFSMHSPKPDDYLDEGITLEQYKAQVSYIQSLVQSMVTAALDNDLEEFANYADVESFVDMYILHELFKNIDTGYSSFYIYRHPGGKLMAGPPWDFDATLGSSPTRGNGSPNGIYVGLGVQAFSSRTASELLISLYATPAFKDEVIARWEELSPSLQDYVDATFTEEMIDTYQFAMGRNYVRWPTPQGYGSPVDQATAEANWETNINILKQWLTDRIAWLDGEWSSS